MTPVVAHNGHSASTSENCTVWTTIRSCRAQQRASQHPRPRTVLSGPSQAAVMHNNGHVSIHVTMLSASPPGTKTAEPPQFSALSRPSAQQSHDSAGELNLGTSTVEKTTSLHEHRDVHPVDELQQQDIDHLVEILQLRSLHSFQHDEHDMHKNGHVNNHVQELDTPTTTCTTGTSSTWSKYCNCGTFTVISTVTTQHQLLYNNDT